MAAPKYEVLVVDDDPNIRETIAMLLMSTGYDVVLARDGFAALLRLRTTVPDVILSDLNMPQMSGFELLSVIRRRFPEILTVAMSGAYQGDQLPEGVIADGFYSKGEHPGKLFGTIEQILCTAAARSSKHHRELAPAWIARNGNDGQGMPYVIVTCTECLRAFHLPVVEDTSGQVLEVECHFC